MPSYKRYWKRMRILAASVFFSSFALADKAPANIFECGIESSSGGSNARSPFLFSMNRFEGDELSIRNIVRYSYQRYDSPLLPETVNMFSEMLDLRYGRVLFQGMMLYHSDEAFSRFSDLGYVVAGGYEFYRSDSEKQSALFWLMCTDQFSWHNFGSRYPVPFVSYALTGDAVNIRVGFPSSFSWKFLPKLTFFAFWVPVYNSDFSIMFAPLPFVSLALQYSLKAESVHLEKFDDEDEKLYIHYQKLQFKVSGYINSHAGVSLWLGRKFNNYRFISHSVLSEDEKASLGAEWYAGASSQLFF